MQEDNVITKFKPAWDKEYPNFLITPELSLVYTNRAFMVHLLPGTITNCPAPGVYTAKATLQRRERGRGNWEIITEPANAGFPDWKRIFPENPIILLDHFCAKTFLWELALKTPEANKIGGLDSKLLEKVNQFIEIQKAGWEERDCSHPLFLGGVRGDGCLMPLSTIPETNTPG